MSRYFFASLCLILITNHSLCQDARKYYRDSIDLNYIPELQIALDSNDRFGEENAFPFKSIRVTDVRFDTTHIGIYSVARNVMIPAVKNYKVNFTSGVGRGLSKYLNNFFQKNLRAGDNELVCFLKKLYLDKRDTLVESVSLHKTYGQVHFQTEVFFRTGTKFYTVFKIDTVLTESIDTRKKEVIDELRDLLLVPALRIMQNKISNTAWDKIVEKRAFSQSEVYGNYFDNRFSLPILTQPYKKGIYQTFAEFKNNAPSISEFKVKKGKSGTISLLDSHENYLVTIKMFGFSDGERCWILRGNFCYPLIRKGNSFEFFVSLIYNLKILFALDMENGGII